MEIVTFKLQEAIIKKIDNMLAPLNFNNRTEFIREAIREKISKIEEESNPVLKALREFQGSATKHLSDKRLHEIREELAKEYAKKYGIKLD